MAHKSETLITIHLRNGRALWCFKYVAAFTDDGFEIRTPSELCNEQMLKMVSQEADRYFGQWPLHILQPVRQKGEVDYPRVRITAFFTASQIRKEMDLSSMVVVWFQDEQMPVPDEVSQTALQDLPWESLARDYQW